MQRVASVLLGLTLVAGGLPLAAPLAAAGNSSITVYTWTDANGITHFSDSPRHPSTAKQLSLPAPPPPNQTALKAETAWLQKLHQQTRADQARAAAQRRAEQEREMAVAERQQQVREPVQYQYLPIFYPTRHRHRHRLHRGKYKRQLPSARFPHYALPSSFPDPLASSFPPGLPSSFPGTPPSPPRRP